MTIDLEALRGRDNTDGILTADRYVKGFLKCSDGDALCPSKIFDMDTKDFDAMVKSRANQLVYVEPEKTLTIASEELMTKAIDMQEKNEDVVKKCLAVFENVMSIYGKDRDGDVMHVKGMDVDNNMPLLWMHMQVQPLGPFLGVSYRDDDMLKGMFGIAATKMGEDVVTLAEVGALRTSIGFNPVEGQVSPLKTATVLGKKKVLTWEVKQCKVMEDSLVSVPSCEDAVITAFSRKALRHELVNAWAKDFYDSRPAMSQGNDIPEGEQTTEVETKSAEVSGTDEVEEKISELEEKVALVIGKGCPEVVAKELDVKQIDILLGDDVTITPAITATIEEKTSLVLGTHAMSLESKMYGMNDYYLPGSHEWLNERLQKQAAGYLIGQGAMSTDHDRYVGIVATFSDEVILCFGPYEEKRCFLVAYAIGEDGDPMLTGEAQEVEIKAEVIKKWFESWNDDLKPDEDEGAPEAVEPEKAISLARQICAKMFDGDDDTVGDAISMMLHANDVYESHDEEAILGAIE